VEENMKRIRMLVMLAVALMMPGVGRTADPQTSPGKRNPMVQLKTSLGDITLELFPDKAPTTVKNFLEYVQAGFYDGTVFHRVIPGFMIQGGGMDSELKEKDGLRAPIKNESSNGLPNAAESVAMARTSVPDSASSQFFINTVDNDSLNREKSRDGVGYAVFGKVVEGMDVVKKIEGTKTSSRGPHQNVPVDPVVITSAKVLGETK
jgi:cyclophilin family peptidyl-prolyl cis-trans isomerase